MLAMTYEQQYEKFITDYFAGVLKVGKKTNAGLIYAAPSRVGKSDPRYHDITKALKLGLHRLKPLCLAVQRAAY